MDTSSRITSLVTGGAGFLGSHLADRLLAEGHRVLVVDNLITGSAANIEHLAGNEHYRFIKADVTEYLFIDEPIDFVFHFAMPASPLDTLEHPIATLKAAALGTRNALGVARAKKARFLLASSSECYGEPLVHPQSEDYWGNVNPIGPCGIYEEAKRFAEAMTIAYHRFHHVDIRIARIFNTYGPRMRLRDGCLIATFIEQALTGQPLALCGEGSQTRSFCYVSDLTEGIYRLALSDFHDPVNLGNPREMTLGEVAQEIVRLSGSHCGIEVRPMPVDAQKVCRPDIARARKVLAWEPVIRFDEGISSTLDYFRNRV